MAETDIVERLRDDADELDFDPVCDLLIEAAAEIERLRAACEAMREVLESMPKAWPDQPIGVWFGVINSILAQHGAKS